MSGSAKQQWASLMKGPTTKSVNKQKFDDNSYDSTERKCKLIPHWHDLFPWLEYNSDEGIIFCSITCRKYHYMQIIPIFGLNR